jgi:hypothetical protein
LSSAVLFEEKERERGIEGERERERERKRERELEIEREGDRGREREREGRIESESDFSRNHYFTSTACSSTWPRVARYKHKNTIFLSDHIHRNKNAFKVQLPIAESEETWQPCILPK